MYALEEEFLAACAFLSEDAELEVTGVELLPYLFFCFCVLLLEEDQHEVSFVEQRPEIHDAVHPKHLSIRLTKQ